MKELIEILEGLVAGEEEDVASRHINIIIEILGFAAKEGAEAAGKLLDYYAAEAALTIDQVIAVSRMIEITESEDE